MILLVSTCSDKLSELEFVRPVESIVKRCNLMPSIRHYDKIRKDDLSGAQKIIICGTALKDFAYLNCTGKFGWLRDTEKPVLGICAGFQIIAKVFDNDLTKEAKIGPFKVKVVQENKLTTMNEFSSYFLSSESPKLGKCFEKLAESENTECIGKHRNREIYGCLFHPEVLNPEIIIGFCRKQ